ncbi:MAG: tRNA (adenosine(37)-N6)-dimethylallyltransferase MiaA, partial [Caulobacteraceae bacterium]
PAPARAAARAAFDRLGEAAFRARLAVTDPAAAARIGAGDRQRLLRAHEVFAATGRALSDWRAATRPTLTPGAWRGVVIEPERAALYRRCDERLAAMAKAGAAAEAGALAARGLDSRLPAMKALGLAAFAELAGGRLSPEEALFRAQGETRRYAKRQFTWFRHQMADWPRLPAGGNVGDLRQILAANAPLTS